MAEPSATAIEIIIIIVFAIVGVYIFSSVAGIAKWIGVGFLLIALFIGLVVAGLI